MKNKKNIGPSLFEKMSGIATQASGSTGAFIIALFVIITWLVSGPFFHFSDTWQLVINTGTTIITFLMVFLIQRSQNKDSIAIHLKLNELILTHEQASNRLVAVENISEEELRVLQKFYRHLALIAKKDLSLEESHSIREADANHERKKHTAKISRRKIKEEN
jgi:low affinity Fe/Cu permease